MVSPVQTVVIIAAAGIVALTIGILVIYSSSVFQIPDGTPRQTANDDKNTPIDVKNNGTASSNPYVKEFSLPKDTWPNGILVDSSGGTVWTVGAKSHSLIAFDPATQNARSYAIPSNSGGQLIMAWAIAEDKDGSILFSGLGRSSPILLFDPEREEYHLIDSPSGAPIQMKLDDEGRIWYTLLSSGIVGVVVENENSGYKATEFEVGKESFPSGMVIQDNNPLWVTKLSDGHVVRFDISTTDGEVTDLTELEVFPREQTFVSPTDILVIDGSVWVTEHNTSFITRYDTTTHKMTRYPTSLHPVHVVTLPYWLEPAGKEGLWFNEHRGNRIAFFDFSENTLTEYEIPTRDPAAGGIANALTIHADPISNANILWFTEFTGNKIGYVDRTVPIPFDLRASETMLTLEQGGSATIDITIMRKDGIPLFNNTLSLSTSSSTITSGTLVNATTLFSTTEVDLTEIQKFKNATLELNDKGLDEGIHMLAISATDGAVTRTVYVELMVVAAAE